MLSGEWRCSWSIAEWSTNLFIAYYDATYIRDLTVFLVKLHFFPRRIPQHTIDNKSTVIQIISWCHQATSHYLIHICHHVVGGTTLQWMVQSICLSVSPSVPKYVHPSVCHTFSSYHEIFRGDYHWQKWCPCKRSRSKVKVTKVKTQFSRYGPETAKLGFDLF